MGSNPRYCKYNCAYMCALCQEAEARDKAKGVLMLPSPANQTPYDPLNDDVDDNAMRWMGFSPSPQDTVDDYGDLSGFPLPRYSPTGGHSHTPAVVYTPPALQVLKIGEVVQIDDEPVIPVSPDQLVVGEIITS